jgi:hypothetical protein
MSFNDCIYYDKSSNKIYVDPEEMNHQFNKDKGTILTFMLNNEMCFSYLSDITINNKRLITFEKLSKLPNKSFEFNNLNSKQQNVVKQMITFMQKIAKGEITLTEKNGDELMLSYYPKLS